jgi:hypothetical protein
VARLRLLALAASAASLGACGKVAATDGVDAPGHETIYTGAIATVPPVTFGGGSFCSYTITLSQVAIAVHMRDSDAGVVSATATVHEVEAIVPPCPFGATPPSDASFTFASEMHVATSLFLAFDGAPGDSPVVTLGVTLQHSDGGFAATLEFHRSDLGPPLDWDVFTTTQLTPLPD